MLADILRRITTRYDNLFEDIVSLFDGISSASDGWVETIRNGIFMHTIFRRSCDRGRCRNFGWYELLGNPQRDITAESAAGRLKEAFGSSLFGSSLKAVAV